MREGFNCPLLPYVMALRSYLLKQWTLWRESRQRRRGELGG